MNEEEKEELAFLSKFLIKMGYEWKGIFDDGEYHKYVKGNTMIKIYPDW